MNKDELYDLYIVRQMPIKAISQMLGVSVGTVFNHLKKYEIQTRSQKETFTFKGKKHSSESVEKIRKAHKGKIVSEETKKKISISSKVGGIGHKKKRTDGYIYIYFPDHPKSNKDGYIMEHDLVMEALIGRHLDDEECVHHINEIKNDNRKENLMLMTKSEHASYHDKKRWKERRDDLLTR